MFSIRNEARHAALVLSCMWLVWISVWDEASRSSPSDELIKDDKINIQWIKHAVALSVLLKVAVTEPRCGQVPQCLFFFSLTRQNRCRQSRANIPSLSFPRGKVPFSLPAWGKNTKATAILDYSLVNRLYLFQFSLQIVFPCPLVKWNVLAQPLVLWLMDSWLFTASTIRLI